MSVAFLFPGQGSQFVGMGKDIYEKYEEVRKIYELASSVTGVDLVKLCFSSTEENLKKTENAQIAIAVTSLGILEVLRKKGIKADFVAGLSLGEYVALTYAGYLTNSDCFSLLKARGYTMGNYLPKGEYEMIAVMGMEVDTVEEICKNMRNNGYFIVPANYNYSGQIVLSGEKVGTEKALELLSEAGAKRVVKLNTSGPFHTEKLEKAKEVLEKELEKIDFRKDEKSVIVFKNLDGSPYGKTDNIQQILSNHMVSPVRFDKTIQNMKNAGIDTFIEIGPGKTMTGFVKKELKDEEIKVYNICDLESLEKYLEEEGING